MSSGRIPGPRRRGRVLALQALYEMDTAGHPPLETVARLSQESRPPKGAVSFGQKLVSGVGQHRKEIDAVIHRHAPAWPVEQLPVIDRSLLRIALFEILFNQETPCKVAINEAVELAKSFGGESSPKFVNGVLGSVVAEQDRETGTKPQK